jgi:pyruvate,orthophosphate dikinase
VSGPSKRWVYDFADGSAEMRALLGGKGANLAEMTTVLGPERVPAGFTITTAACVEYMRAGTEALPEGLEAQIAAALERLEAGAGKRFGDPEEPLLLSVRSGAPVSMPGMLDTILNLGLNSDSVAGFARTANPELAWDCRRRLVQMFAEVVRGADPAPFERELEAARTAEGVASDGELGAAALERVATRFEGLFEEHAGEPFPDDPREQLVRAVRAVFDSWRNERAVTYRRLNGIPDDLGTAVTVQRMVFGNLGETSGSGVAFSRDPTSGDPAPDGDFLLDAQGEDVVAGVRNTEDLDGLAARMPAVHAELLDCLQRLERHFRDIQDVEYTVEAGRLFILQTRSAKRHAKAAVRFAVDGVAEGMLSPADALRTIEPGSLDALLHPAFDPEATPRVLATGVAASPGAAKGAIALTAGEAERRAAEGEDVILVRPFTSADDVGGFHAARGILTAQGGKSSHAAIVARGMGRPCVCGATDVHVDADGGTVTIGETALREGDLLAIDGSSGIVTADDVPMVAGRADEALDRVLGWADELRRLGVRANADTAEDAARARELGAEGIGLCRTEHMFFGDDRERLVRDMFIAGELARRERADGGPAGEHASAFERALAELERVQSGDFAALLREMSGLPVTIRLLDPPLHEFIGVASFERELEEAERAGDAARALAARERLAIAGDLEETNPMLGTRGARLGLTLGGVYEMQVRAVVAATAAVEAEGEPPEVEIMLPLIAFEGELAALRDSVERTVADAGGGREVRIGTMIELPRACLIADRLAALADFFSFGTNDLTQTALGLSRDDAERGFLPAYIERGIVPRGPFESLDRDGVGKLVRMAVELARGARPAIGLGVCGEHGGDPASIEFFHEAELDYVSCSPHRVPIARLAAARAAIG